MNILITGNAGLLDETGRLTLTSNHTIIGIDEKSK